MIRWVKPLSKIHAYIRYRPVYDHHQDQGSVGHLMAKQEHYNDPEMVTVPVLGAE